MAFEELAQRHADLGALISVKGAAFQQLMGPQWARRDQDIPFFLRQQDLADLAQRGSLNAGQRNAAMERFLSNPRVFEDRSEACESVRSAYRDILTKAYPGILGEIEARVKASLGRPEEACRNILFLLSLWPRDPRLDPDAKMSWFVAGSCRRRLGNLAGATDFLRISVELDGRFAPALNELGTCLCEQGNTDEGNALYDRALAEAPNDVLTLSNAAGYRLSAGRLNEARALLVRAKSLAPDDEFVNRLLNLAAP